MGQMEQLIDECGGFNKYQILILFGILVQKLSVGWSMMQMSYAGYIPDWYCGMGQLAGNATSYTTTNNNDSATLLKQCHFNNSDTGYMEVACLSYEFQGSARTIMTEWDLVCDRKWIKKTITSIQMAGVLLGAMFAGQLADVIGRKKTMFGFVLCHSLINFGAAYATSWEMFAGFRFALGIGAGALLVVTTPYPMEFLPTRWRPIITVVPTMSVGISLMALAAYLYPDWSFLHLACGTVGLPFMLCWFFVPESVRWLTLQGRNKEAEAIIAKMASVNGFTFPPQTGAVLKGIYEEEQASSSKQKKYSYTDLFKSAYLAKLTLAFCFLWFTIAMVFYGISFGATSLAGNLELNIFLLTMVDQPSIFSTFYLNNRFGRKKTCLGLMGLSLVGSCGCFATQFAVSESSRGAWITAFSLVAKMGLGAAWAAVGVWSTELYPTVIRSVGSGIVNSAAKLGGIAAPFAIDLDSHPIVAYAIITVLFVLAILVCFVIPESMGCNLSDSINIVVVPEKTAVVDVVVMGDGNNCRRRSSVGIQLGGKELEKGDVTPPTVCNHDDSVNENNNPSSKL